MLLTKIKEDVAKFADVISKTLDVDVLIVDSNLNVVGNTFRYFDKYTGIRRVSVIGQVLTTGKVVAIDDRSRFGACKVCPDFYECEMRGFIGVPIIYRDCVVGAIGLILPQQRIAHVFQDVRNSIDFLESMADLLSNKLRGCDDYTALSIIKQEREVLMDAIDAAIVSTDNIGYISYHNKAFSNRFCAGKSCVGQLLSNLITHKMVRECLVTPVEVHDRLIYSDDEDRSFYGLMCCSSIVVGDERTGVLFIFKSIRHINSEFSQIAGADEDISFARYEQKLFTAGLVSDAKCLSVTDKIILISCAPDTGDQLLASCIHNFSDRRRAPMHTIDCGQLYDLAEQTIFGELGRLHMAHRGTVLFRRIELLPFPLQRRLVDFLQTKELLHHGGRGISVNVKLVFSSYANLKQMADEGKFLDELYYRIAENILPLPPIGRDRAHLRNMIEWAVSFYICQHQKPNSILSTGALRLLCHYAWQGNLAELCAVLDLLVEKCGNTITEEDVLALSDQFGDVDDASQSIDQLQREHIRQLLETGYHKDSVARMLGIGRATLYRKIKQYQL